MLEKEYIDNWYTCFAAVAVLISIPIVLLFLKLLSPEYNAPITPDKN